jgi:hypothetical protein
VITTYNAEPQRRQIVDQHERLIDTLQALEALLDRHKVRFASVVTDLLTAVPASSESDIKAA